jgi:hypothetical protein
VYSQEPKYSAWISCTSANGITDILEQFVRAGEINKHSTHHISTNFMNDAATRKWSKFAETAAFDRHHHNALQQEFVGLC